MSDILEELSAANLHAGLVMVKPHAFAQVLDPIIAETLSARGLSFMLHDGDPLIDNIYRIQVATPAIRDLNKVSYGRQLLDLFYRANARGRFYPLLMQHYLGKVAFIPFVYNGTLDQYAKVPNLIKGKASTFDADGNQISEARGIRGILCTPYLYVSIEEGRSLDDAVYERCFEPAIKNYIHVCDNEPEINFTLRTLFPEKELAEIMTSLARTT